MRTLVGRGTNTRAAVGPVVVARPMPVPPANEPPGDPCAVVEAFARVRDRLTAAASGCANPAVRDVLEATAEMADDPWLVDAATRRVTCGIPPAHAVGAATDEVCASLEALGGMMAERVTDVRSVGHRVVAELLGLPEPGLGQLVHPAVVVAEDLSPADTADLDPSHLLGVVTERGGPTGHTAIIAGQLGIPCVVQVAGASSLRDGDVVAVDARAGQVVVDPDAGLVSRIQAGNERLDRLAANVSPGRTSDGQSAPLMANIGSAEDVARAIAAGAEGVGLFRTELLYLGQAEEPSVESQVAAYQRVFASAGGRKVVVRTLDAGADKPLAFAQPDDEPNPALGIRGYRTVRQTPGLLDRQLEAIATAGRLTEATPWVMAPMVSVPAEAEEFAERARQAGIPRVGAMIEVPSAALDIERVLEPLDFVSIGTNDLAQYTMAADRLADRLSDLLDPWQPTVLGLVARVAAAGVAAGKPVGVCGEAAGDPVMAPVLVGLGVSSLSMAPAALPAVRFALGCHTTQRCRELAAMAIAAGCPAAARDRIVGAMADEVRDALALRPVST